MGRRKPLGLGSAMGGGPARRRTLVCAPGYFYPQFGARQEELPSRLVSHEDSDWRVPVRRLKERAVSSFPGKSVPDDLVSCEDYWFNLCAIAHENYRE